jgi:formylmethanofuran dehydrogenase subunit E
MGINSNNSVTVNNEYQNMWKEATTDCFNVLHKRLHGKPEKNLNKHWAQSVSETRLEQDASWNVKSIAVSAKLQGENTD